MIFPDLLVDHCLSFRSDLRSHVFPPYQLDEEPTLFDRFLVEAENSPCDPFAFVGDVAGS